MVSYYPDVVGAKRQEMVFEVIVDRQKPELGTASYNPVTHRFRPSQWLDRGQAGVLRDSVFTWKQRMTSLIRLPLMIA